MEENQGYNREQAMSKENITANLEKIAELTASMSNAEKKQFVIDYFAAGVMMLPKVLNTPGTRNYVTVVGSPVSMAINKVAGPSRLINPLMAQSAGKIELRPIEKFRNKDNDPVVIYQVDDVVTSPVVEELVEQTEMFISALESDAPIGSLIYDYPELAKRSALSKLGLGVTTTEPTELTLALFQEGRDAARLLAAQREAVKVADESIVNNNPNTPQNEPPSSEPQAIPVKTEATPPATPNAGEGEGATKGTKAGGKKS